jgi:hypothetical protein
MASCSPDTMEATTTLGVKATEAMPYIVNSVSARISKNRNQKNLAAVHSNLI